MDGAGGFHTPHGWPTLSASSSSFRSTKFDDFKGGSIRNKSSKTWPGPVEGSQTSVARFPAIVHLIWGLKESRSCQCRRPRLVDFENRNNEHFRIFHRLRSEYVCFKWMNIHSSWSRYPSHPVKLPFEPCLDCLLSRSERPHGSRTLVLARTDHKN